MHAWMSEGKNCNKQGLQTAVLGMNYLYSVIYKG